MFTATLSSAVRRTQFSRRIKKILRTLFNYIFTAITLEKKNKNKNLKTLQLKLKWTFKELGIRYILSVVGWIPFTFLFRIA